MSFPAQDKRSRILVVDDDQLLNMLFCGFLESKQIIALSAHSVEEAKEILQREAFLDLILLDYQLGDGVGLDLLTPEMLDTYLSRPPVIMISANEESTFLETCFRSGVHDYIIKPVNLSLLALKVETLIKTEAMRRLITQQNNELERFKFDAEREEQIAKFTYDYLLHQNSNKYEGVEVWLKSFAAFSGDITLVKKSPGGNLFFMLADATGHGLSAAITIMPMVTIFNDLVQKGFELQKIVTEINRTLVRDTPEDRFVAAIVFELDPYKQQLNVWNGGMPHAYWMMNGEMIHEYKSKHMSLGILDENMFDATAETFDIPNDGYVIAFSDGLIEQENIDGIDYTLERVVYHLRRNPDDIIKCLSESLERHTGMAAYDDDVSICVIKPKEVFAIDLSPLVSPIEFHSSDQAFFWELCVRGKYLASIQIPPLCINFLQSMGVDQRRCQKIFAVVAEIISNALDHGILELSSDLKEEPDGFLEYLNLRESRMNQLTEKDFIEVKLNYKHKALEVEITDSGKGYTPVERDAESAPKYSGRGTNLIKNLSESFELIVPGNKVKVVIH